MIYKRRENPSKRDLTRHEHKSLLSRTPAIAAMKQPSLSRPLACAKEGTSKELLRDILPINNASSLLDVSPSSLTLHPQTCEKKKRRRVNSRRPLSPTCPRNSLSDPISCNMLH